MARRNRDAQPPALAAEFSDCEPIPAEAIVEILDKASAKLRKAETWQEAGIQFWKTFQQAAKAWGGMA